MADTRRLPGPNADVWDWQLQAACRGMSSAYFFHPEGERGPARARREAQAKAICLDCPALLPCRRHALAVHEPYGIWGGLSESERAQLITAAEGEALRPAATVTPLAGAGAPLAATVTPLAGAGTPLAGAGAPLAAAVG